MCNSKLENGLVIGQSALDLVAGFSFADLLCSAANKSAYVVLSHVIGEFSAISIGDWANGKPEEASKAPHVAHSKAGELVWSSQSDGVSTTPVPELDTSLKWKGGVRYADNIVAVSHWSQEHDQLLAAIVCFFLNNNCLDLHHFGFSCTQAEFELLKSTGQGYFFDGIDQQRIFLPVENSGLGYGKYYVEYFYNPNEEYEPSVHWDLVCQCRDDSPCCCCRFLSYITDVTGVESETCEYKENGPAGGVFIKDSNGYEMGVMVRSSFWEIK